MSVCGGRKGGGVGREKPIVLERLTTFTKISVKIVRQMVLALSCIIYKIPVNLSLSLQRKPGSCNRKKMVQKMSVVTIKAGEKKVIHPKV